MGKNGKFFLIGIAGLFIYSLVKKAAAGQKINTFFKGIKVLKPSGFALPKIQAIFLLQNPSSQQIEINSLVGSLAVNGKFLSNLTNFKKIIVPGNSQVELPITVSTGLLDAVTTIVALLKDKSKNVTASFDGNVNAENFVIPIKQIIKIV